MSSYETKIRNYLKKYIKDAMKKNISPELILQSCIRELNEDPYIYLEILTKEEVADRICKQIVEQFTKLSNEGYCNISTFITPKRMQQLLFEKNTIDDFYRLYLVERLFRFLFLTSKKYGFQSETKKSFAKNKIKYEAVLFIEKKAIRSLCYLWFEINDTLKGSVSLKFVANEGFVGYDGTEKKEGSKIKFSVIPHIKEEDGVLISLAISSLVTNKKRLSKVVNGALENIFKEYYNYYL